MSNEIRKQTRISIHTIKNGYILEVYPAGVGYGETDEYFYATLDEALEKVKEVIE